MIKGQLELERNTAANFTFSTDAESLPVDCLTAIADQYPDNLPVPAPNKYTDAWKHISDQFKARASIKEDSDCVRLVDQHTPYDMPRRDGVIQTEENK